MPIDTREEPWLEAYVHADDTDLGPARKRFDADQVAAVDELERSGADPLHVRRRLSRSGGLATTDQTGAAVVVRDGKVETTERSR